MIETSKNSSGDRLLPRLQKPKDEIRSFLLGKIQEGEEKFLKPTVSNQEKLDQLRHDYTNWKSYNEEYLKRVFTTDEISYKYSHSPYPLDIINHFRANAFLKTVESFKKEVKNNIGILEQILTNLDLYEMQETTSLGGQMNFLQDNLLDQRSSPEEDRDIILNHVYSHLPSPVRFNAENIEELTGYKKDEEKFIKFLQTIDFLVEEGYLRCPSKYVKDSMNPEPIIHLHQNVTITQHGINNIKKTDKSPNFGGQRDSEQKYFRDIVVGNNSHVNIYSTDYSINTISVDNQSLDIVSLAEELERLRNELLLHAESAEHYSLIGQVASAESAAKTKNISDLKQILSKLKPIAGWVLNIAKAIGVPIAIKALEARIIN